MAFNQLLETLFIFFLSNVSGVARIVAAIGGYMTLTMGLMFADDFGCDFGMKDAAVLNVAFDLGSFFTVWSLREHISFSFLLVVGVPWTAFDLLGTKVLIGNEQASWLKPAFGALLFVVLVTDAYAVWRNSKEVKITCKAVPNKLPEEEQGNELPNSLGRPSCNDISPTQLPKVLPRETEKFDCFQNWRWCLFLGVAGGSLKGLFTVPMPVLVLFVLFSGIDRHTYRANIILLCMAEVLPKGYYLFYVNQEMEWAKFPHFVAATLGVMAATPIGNFVANRVDKEQFKDIVRLFAFTGGCFMLAAGKSFQLPFSVASLVLGIFMMCYRWRKRRGDAEGEQSLPGEAEDEKLESQKAEKASDLADVKV